jgi:hypothetical protein
MLLRITDGTETAILSGGTGAGTFLGATYNPRPPSDERKPVAEDARVILEGASKDVIADTQKLERLLAIARSDPSSNVRVYVEFQRTGDTLVWRSQIRDGRLLWSDDPIRRVLVTAATSVEVVVTWEREPFWESSTEITEAAKHLFNADGYGTDPDGVAVGTTGADAYNAVEFAAAVMTGVLPTPTHLVLKNNDGTAASLRRAWFANDVFARFADGEHLVAGNTLTWGAGSTHGLPLVTYLALSADQVAGMVAAGGARLLAVFSTLPTGKYVKAWLLQKQGSAAIYSVAWMGPELLTNGGMVLDCGFCPAPPNVRVFTGWYLAFSVYSVASGTAELEFVQLCPGRDLLMLEITDIDPWADNGTLEWYGDRQYAEINGWHGEVRASGRLMLQPNRANRIMVVVEGSVGIDNALALTLTLNHRARRATV